MQFRRFASLALVAALAACSGYDQQLLGSRTQPPAKDGGLGAHDVVLADGAVRVADGGWSDAATDASAMPGNPGAVSGAAGTSGGGNPTGATECIPNTDTSRPDCRMICPEQCNGLDDDCDDVVDEQVENACTLGHATAACVRGRCAIVQCDTGYRDCDHDAASGCEVTPGDPSNCGGCGVRCSFGHASAACMNDQCVPASCDALYRDCDQNPADCETMVSTLQNCGACGKTCADGDVANAASVTCATGTCGVGQCATGYGDCDGMPMDGCEQTLSTNTHCGACNAPCDFVGSIDDCSSGSCLAQSCEPGYDDCDGNPGNGCESLDQPAHCGACTKTCDTSLSNVTSADCASGTCALACASGYGDCDGDPSTGCETPLDSQDRCGGCNKPCTIDNADASCSSGTCTLVRCKPGFGDCNGNADDGCETPLDQNDHCGACGTSCVGTSRPVCSGGTCSTLACPTGQGDCDHDGVSCEADLTSDLNNCGACSNACAFAGGTTHASGLGCVASQCVPTCDALFGNCNGNYADGCETPLDALNNCGACGRGCSIANATASCGGGSCHVSQCAPDYADCNGDGLSCETKLGTTANCTGCNQGCALPNAIASCAGIAGSHSCAVSSCAQPYYLDCNGQATDGCEIDDRGDLGNCGACGSDCSKLPNVVAPSCVDAACAFGCQSGYANCNSMPGCETPLNTNTDCAGCGVSCSRANGSASCSTGSCTLTGCNNGYKDCDGNPNDGCEPLTTLSNCGDCGVTCTIANGTGTCASSSCAVASCSAGWADCDAVASNGCERNVNPPAMGGQGPCLPDTNCVHQSYNGQDYYFCPTARTWSDARTHCQQQLLGDLAHPNDSAEDAFLKSHLTADAWLGATDSASEGVWRFTDDNSQFWMGAANGGVVSGAYTHWASNQPGGGTNQNCAAVVQSSGAWDDIGCNSTRAFVCEVQLDQCPSDPNKIKPGQCGCGVADTDTDGDGTPDCNDGCPSDKNKIAPGVCGCGVADTDTDGDGTPDCNDGCPSDKSKTAPGVCGCGVPDVDTDGDTILDCKDPCPTNASNPPGCFPYVPSNVDVTSQSFAGSPSWNCTNNATTTLDSSTATLSGDTCGGTATLDATNGVAQLDATGTSVMIVRLTGLTVTGSHVIKLKGDKPIVFLVNGNVLVDSSGKIDASATGITPGPGGSTASQCTAQTGGNGKSATSGSDDSDGGGGGGFGTAGGTGGGGNGRTSGGTAGAVSSKTTLVPLRGGCSGGNGGDATRGSTLKGYGGGGGGAFQISASGTIAIGTGSNAAILSAAGGGGQGNDHNNDCPLV